MTKLPKDFGRIKMEEEMLRQDAKRRMKEYHQEHGKLDWKDYLYIIPAFLLLAVIIGSAVINL